MSDKLNVLLAGGGHAMLPFLSRAGSLSDIANITLINDTPYLYYSGMIPEFLGGVYSKEEVSVDLRAICTQNKVRFIEACAQHIDPENHLLQTDRDQTLRYDIVAFDIGSLPPRPQKQHGGIPTKPLHNILSLSGILQNNDKLTIAGGGAAGVEVVLNISGRMHKEINNGSFSLILIEASNRLLPAFPKGVSEYVQNLLHDRGVQLYLSTRSVAYDHHELTLDTGEKIQSSLLLWATGTRSHPIFNEAGLQTDEQGFLLVDDHLRCPEYPEILAAGDCATIISQPGLPKIGVHAVKQGLILQQNLISLINEKGNKSKHKKLTAFRPYPVSPLIITTGQKEAIWVADSIWIHNSSILRLKHIIDRRWIRQYQSGFWSEKSLPQLADTRNAWYSFQKIN